MESDKTKQVIRTNVLIPAYDKNKQGILFHLVMEAVPNHSFSINADGTIALALKKMLGRAISIMSGLNVSWSCLKDLSFTLISNQNQFRVMDARSAGLPLCIALMNVLRQLNGLKQVQSLTGSGVLRIDGTFEKSLLEEKKEQVSSQTRERTFIHSEWCNHVFDLASLMSYQ